MRITEFSASDFRNLKSISIKADENVNVIFGENAQGKTNILEAMWLFSSVRSFRGARDREMIAFGKRSASINLGFYAAGREQNAKIILSDKKKLTLNGIKEDNFKRISESLKMIVFSPVHLSLIKNGPSERRSFIDTALMGIKGGYYSLVSEYMKTLSQRNALLRDAKYNSSLIMLLEAWDERLAFLGAKIILQRKKYILNLAPVISDVFDGISEGKERVTLRYSRSADENDENEIYTRLLSEIRSARCDDFETLSTTKGPHRDDILIEINGRSARAYASQGQQRSCALALKIGEAAVLEKITGIAPVVLLDDVMSELDTFRQEYIFNNIKKNQIFITCCEPSSLLRGRNGKIFEIKNGEIVTSKA